LVFQSYISFDTRFSFASAKRPSVGFCEEKKAERVFVFIRFFLVVYLYRKTATIVELKNNYLLTYDSYVPVYNRFPREEWITRASGGEGALDTPGP
jgi:hypothetical protein